MSSKVNVRVDASEMSKAARTISRYSRNLLDDVALEFLKEQPEQVENFILNYIGIKFENTDTDRETTSLKSSFILEGSARTRTLRSNAPHAAPLEIGRKGKFASRYRIPSSDDIGQTPWNGSDGVSYQPENPAEYGDLVNEDGWVSFNYVNWSAFEGDGLSYEGYGYVESAQEDWDKNVRRDINRYLREAAKKAGYKR